jgi:hypothetical protein
MALPISILELAKLNETAMLVENLKSKKLRDANHLCNNARKLGSYGYGTYSTIFLLTQIGDFDTLSSSMFLS